MIPPNDTDIRQVDPKTAYGRLEFVDAEVLSSFEKLLEHVPLRLLDRNVTGLQRGRDDGGLLGLRPCCATLTRLSQPKALAIELREVQCMEVKGGFANVQGSPAFLHSC